MEKRKILSVVGARPNFIKLAPLHHELKKTDKYRHIIVHTGQHFDYEMSRVFFNELGLPDPDIHLNIGGKSESQQTSEAIKLLEPIYQKYKPDLAMVVGDVTSTLAGALTAARLHIPIAHVEAGLRSFDLDMPEEVNRRLTDNISQLLFVSEDAGIENLQNEGIKHTGVHLVGNIMVDALRIMKPKIESARLPSELSGLRDYIVMTLHRQSNVDDKKRFTAVLKQIEAITKQIPVVWPIHPRSAKRLKEFKMRSFLSNKNIIITKPLGYIEFLALVQKSQAVISDSGGLQAETTYLNVPCFTLRAVTEQPSTIFIGTNQLVTDIKKLSVVVLSKPKKCHKLPNFWDGRTAQRIAAKISSYLND